MLLSPHALSGLLLLHVVVMAVRGLFPTVLGWRAHRSEPGPVRLPIAVVTGLHHLVPAQTIAWLWGQAERLEQWRRARRHPMRVGSLAIWLLTGVSATLLVRAWIAWHWRAEFAPISPWKLFVSPMEIWGLPTPASWGPALRTAIVGQPQVLLTLWMILLVFTMTHTLRGGVSVRRWLIAPLRDVMIRHWITNAGTWTRSPGELASPAVLDLLTRCPAWCDQLSVPQRRALLQHPEREERLRAIQVLGRAQAAKGPATMQWKRRRPPTAAAH